MNNNTKHWAYGLPDLPRPYVKTPCMAREEVACHKKPEYCALMWGWSEADILAAKRAAGVFKNTQ